MGDNTGISWTDATWNPIVGCSIVSPGCTNCYAMKMADRLKSMAPKPDGTGNHGLLHYNSVVTRDPTGRGYDWSNPVWTGKMVMAPEHILLQPLKWKRPRRIFVNSMSDLFHESVPDEWIDKVFAVMALSPQHIFQVLTKRSKRTREYHCGGAGARTKDIFDGLLAWPLSNVHLGVSCEDQTRADERVPDLLATPAAVRFVSAEPLLGPIIFQSEWLNPVKVYEGGFTADLDASFVDQIIVGGESGPGHRPMQIEWAEDIMRQCQKAGTAFFFKQDSGPRSGMRGRASDELWACKQMVEGK